MRRREFVALLAGAAAGPSSLWPFLARAQHAPKVAVVGALVIDNTDPEQFWREFRQGLRDLGYIEGQNIRYEFRSAQGQLNRLPELAAELVRLKVESSSRGSRPPLRRQSKPRTKSPSSWRTREIRSARDSSPAFLGRAATSPELR